MIGDGTDTLTLAITSLSASPPQFTRHAIGAQLCGIDGPATGCIVIVSDGQRVIGSSDDCDLALVDSTLSRRHLQARWNGHRLELLDLESKNGSFYAGKRFDCVEVGFGEEFRVGKSLFKVVPAEEEVEPEATESSCFGDLVGVSATMRKLFTLIDQVAPSDVSVLIEGETGVGKELVAEEIHRRSGRRDRPFMVFDCGAVPAELIESALFGHARGAFTGANQDRTGLFDDANGGTVFLDEIGELRSDLQPSLLRVLDRGMVRAVGANQFHTVNVRIVAATHRNLGEMIESGQFREDLYYRLAAVRLSVPPLRDRVEDIEVLARHFLARSSRPGLAITPATLAAMCGHSWPGNIRELKNAVERGVALSSSGNLTLDNFPGAHRTSAKIPVGNGGAAFRTPSGDRRPFRDAKAEAIETFERAYLADLMSAHTTLSAAAQAANMDRKHLRVILRRYGMLD